MTKPRTIMTRCNDCNHIWKRPKYANRKCPKCGSTRIGEVTDGGGPTVAPGPDVDLDLSPIEDEAEEPEPPVTTKTEKQKAKVADTKTAKGMAMYNAIPAKSDYIAAEDLTAQEKMIGDLLAGVGVKQPTAIAKILGRGPTDNPKWLDSILNRHGISYQQRLLVHDILFPDDMDSDKEPSQKGGDTDDFASGMKEMFGTMRQMWMMSMMKDMMGGGNQPRGENVPLQAPQRPPEMMVPLPDENGNPTIDTTTGEVVKVPVSIFMAYKSRQHSERPSTLQEFMQFQQMQLDSQTKFFAALGGNRGDPAEQMKLVAEKLAAQNEAKMQELNAARQSEITTLKAQVETDKRLEERDRQWGVEMKRVSEELEKKRREVEKMADSKAGDALSVQTDIQRKTGDVLTETIKGATQEFREGRKEMRSIFTEQMRQQTIVDGARQQRQATTTSVMEVPLDQVGRELDSMEQQEGMQVEPPQAQQPVRRPKRDTLDLSILVGEGD